MRSRGPSAPLWPFQSGFPVAEAGVQAPSSPFLRSHASYTSAENRSIFRALALGLASPPEFTSAVGRLATTSYVKRRARAVAAAATTTTAGSGARAAIA